MSFVISSGKYSFLKGGNAVSNLNGIKDSQGESILGYLETLENAKNEALNSINGDIEQRVDLAIGNFINQHQNEFGANLTLEDGSITLNKIAIGTLGFVSPEMYGAAGNGTTDDSVAVEEAIQEGCKKQIPILINKTYLVTKKIYINGSASGYHDRIYIFGNGRIKFAPSNSSHNITISLDYFDHVYVDGIMGYMDNVPDNTSPSFLAVGKSTKVDIVNCDIRRFKSGIYIKQDEVGSQNEHLTHHLYVNNCRFYNCYNGITVGSTGVVNIVNSFFESTYVDPNATVTVPISDNHIKATYDIDRLVIHNCIMKVYNNAAISLSHGFSNSDNNSSNAEYDIKDLLIHGCTIIGPVTTTNGINSKCALRGESITRNIIIDNSNIRDTVPVILPNGNYKNSIIKIQNSIINNTNSDLWLGNSFYKCDEFGFYDCRITAGRLTINGNSSGLQFYIKDCYYESLCKPNDGSSHMFAYIAEGTSAYLYLSDNQFKSHKYRTKPTSQSNYGVRCKSAFCAKAGRIYAFNNRFDFNEPATDGVSYIKFVFENTGSSPIQEGTGANTFVLGGNIVNINKDALSRSSNNPNAGYGFFANKAKTRNLINIANYFPDTSGNWQVVQPSDLITGNISYS